MNKLLVALAWALAALPLFAAEPALKPITHEDVWLHRRVSAPVPLSLIHI